MRPDESFVGQPIRSLQTMLRVLGEDDPALPPLVPDGIYGQETIQAVSAFQRRYSLPITGVADQRTWDEIVRAYEPALVRLGKAEPIEIIMEPNQIYRRSDRDPNLYLLQAILLFLSTQHDSISEPGMNGILDAPTSEALAGFQLLAGLPPTGELDRITWTYLVKHFTLNTNKVRTQS